MGCCQSSSRSHDSSSAYSPSAGHANSSSRGLTNQRHVGSGRTGDVAGAPVIVSEPPTARSTPRTPGDSVGQPLRRHVWASKRRRWTRRQLDVAREEFFDTRVTGRAEAWHAIRMAIEMMGEDLETAQTILDAAGVVLPTGDLVNGAYDEIGNFYQIPEYCISDPVNLIHVTEGTDETAKKDEGEAATAATRDGQHDADSTSQADDDDDDDSAAAAAQEQEQREQEEEEEAARRRKEKGKGKALKTMPVSVSHDTITVRARLSDRGGPDVRVQLKRHSPVKTLIRRIQEEADIISPPPPPLASSSPSISSTTAFFLDHPTTITTSNTTPTPPRRGVKIVYLGKVLRESESLEAQGWKEGHVVNALVFQ